MKKKKKKRKKKKTNGIIKFLNGLILFGNKLNDIIKIVFFKYHLYYNPFYYNYAI